MSASRWSRPITTPRCPAHICCGNRNMASRARCHEASGGRPRRHGSGDLGACLCRQPDRARRILAGADDGVALCDSRGAVPVRAQARGFLAALDRDRRHAVSRPVPGPGLWHRAWRAGRLDQRHRAEPGAVHHRVRRHRLSRTADASANPRHRHRRHGPADDLRQRREVPMLHLFPWFCLVPPLPLLALALVTDGPQATWHSLIHMSLTGLLCMLALGAISTSIAYWLWGRLLRDYPAAQVVPFALLVPFVGAAASTLVFGERFGPLRLSGMVIVVCGIGVMLLSKRSQVLPKIA